MVYVQLFFLLLSDTNHPPVTSCYLIFTRIQVFRHEIIVLTELYCMHRQYAYVCMYNCEVATCKVCMVAVLISQPSVE
jgi:hypothetical protein